MPLRPTRPPKCSLWLISHVETKKPPPSALPHPLSSPRGGSKASPVRATCLTSCPAPVTSGLSFFIFKMGIIRALMPQVEGGQNGVLC